MGHRLGLKIPVDKALQPEADFSAPGGLSRSLARYARALMLSASFLAFSDVFWDGKVTKNASQSPMNIQHEHLKAITPSNIEPLMIITNWR